MYSHHSKKQNNNTSRGDSGIEDVVGIVETMASFSKSDDRQFIENIRKKMHEVHSLNPVPPNYTISCSSGSSSGDSVDDPTIVREDTDPLPRIARASTENENQNSNAEQSIDVIYEGYSEVSNIPENTEDENASKKDVDRIMHDVDSLMNDNDLEKQSNEESIFNNNINDNEDQDKESHDVTIDNRFNMDDMIDYNSNDNYENDDIIDNKETKYSIDTKKLSQSGSLEMNVEGLSVHYGPSEVNKFVVLPNTHVMSDPKGTTKHKTIVNSATSDLRNKKKEKFSNPKKVDPDAQTIDIPFTCDESDEEEHEKKNKDDTNVIEDNSNHEKKEKEKQEEEEEEEEEEEKEEEQEKKDEDRYEIEDEHENENEGEGEGEDEDVDEEYEEEYDEEISGEENEDKLCLEHFLSTKEISKNPYLQGFTRLYPEITVKATKEARKKANQIPEEQRDDFFVEIAKKWATVLEVNEELKEMIQKMREKTPGDSLMKFMMIRLEFFLDSNHKKRTLQKAAESAQSGIVCEDRLDVAVFFDHYICKSKALVAFSDRLGVLAEAFGGRFQKLSFCMLDLCKANGFRAQQSDMNAAESVDILDGSRINKGCGYTISIRAEQERPEVESGRKEDVKKEKKLKKDHVHVNENEKNNNDKNDDEINPNGDIYNENADDGVSIYHVKKEHADLIQALCFALHFDKIFIRCALSWMKKSEVGPFGKHDSVSPIKHVVQKLFFERKTELGTLAGKYILAIDALDQFLAPYYDRVNFKLYDIVQENKPSKEGQEEKADEAESMDEDQSQNENEDKNIKVKNKLTHAGDKSKKLTLQEKKKDKNRQKRTTDAGENDERRKKKK